MKTTNRLPRPKTTMMSSGRSSRVWVLAVALAMPLGAVLTATPVMAEQKSPAPRSVEGVVVNKGDTPLNGAVVYLKDSKSLSVKSYITDAEGKFRFTQLSQNADYEVWADSNGVRCKSKTISSFDNKSSFNFRFVIDTVK